MVAEWQLSINMGWLWPMKLTAAILLALACCGWTHGVASVAPQAPAISADPIITGASPDIAITPNSYQTGDIFKVYDNSVLICTASALTSGQLSGLYFPGGCSALASGTHPIQLTVTRGGVESAKSNSVNVVVP
jgi:hypothetical protein